MLFDDVFPLENSKELTCRIDSYEIGHSVLWIRVMNRGEFVCYLYLSSAKYIAAPMCWQSADFRIASAKDCEQLLIKLGYPQILAEEHSIDHLKLYRVEHSDVSMTIEILAVGVQKINYDERLPY